jgi:hypothetical protein
MTSYYSIEIKSTTIMTPIMPVTVFTGYIAIDTALNIITDVYDNYVKSSVLLSKTDFVSNPNANNNPVSVKGVNFIMTQLQIFYRSIFSLGEGDAVK